jgi:hypothetical protein
VSPSSALLCWPRGKVRVARRCLRVWRRVGGTARTVVAVSAACHSLHTSLSLCVSLCSESPHVASAVSPERSHRPFWISTACSLALLLQRLAPRRARDSGTGGGLDYSALFVWAGTLCAIVGPVGIGECSPSSRVLSSVSRSLAAHPQQFALSVQSPAIAGLFICCGVRTGLMRVVLVTLQV